MLSTRLDDDDDDDEEEEEVKQKLYKHISIHFICGLKSAGGVMVVTVADAHGELSSNPERGSLHFTKR